MGPCISCKELAGTYTQSIFEPDNVIGRKNYIKVTAALGETPDTFMTQETEGILISQPLHLFHHSIIFPGNFPSELKHPRLSAFLTFSKSTMLNQNVNMF
jgi:hypothetical protein